MSSYDNLYQQITSRSSVASRFTFFSDSYALSVINTCRNRYFDFLFIGNITAAVAICTFLTVPKKDCWVNTT